MRFFKLAVAAVVILAFSPRIASTQQGSGLYPERVPTQRLRTDTFPRWQNPTRLSQFLVMRNPPNPTSNPRVILPDDPLDATSFQPTDIAVDSRGVVHIAGAWFGNSPNAGVYYITNSPDTRTASGFSMPVMFAQTDGYQGGGDARICADADDNIHIYWCAVIGQSFSGQVRDKADVFRVVKGSQVWSNVTKVTTATCQVDYTERFDLVQIVAGPTGGVRAAARRSELQWQWVPLPNPPPAGYWQLLNFRPLSEPFPYDRQTLVYWNDITTNGTPIQVGTNEFVFSVESIAVKGSASPNIAHTALTGSGTQWAMHGFGISATGGMATDACGARGWPWNSQSGQMAPLQAGDFSGYIHSDMNS